MSNNSTKKEPTEWDFARSLYKKGNIEKSIRFFVLLLPTLFFFLPVVAQIDQTPVKNVVPESVSLNYIFTVLFLMLGPFKIIGPFAKITEGADRKLSRNIAIQAFLYSSLALLVAAFLGEAILKKYDIPLAILALAGGIILFLVALIAIIENGQQADGSVIIPEVLRKWMPGNLEKIAPKK